MTLDFESKQTPAMKNMPEVNTTLQTIIVFIFTARRHTSAVDLYAVVSVCHKSMLY